MLDGRTLDHKTLAEIRKRAVLRVEAGESPEQVIDALGFHRACIYRWLAKYREGGLAALEAKPVPGRPSRMTGSQLYRLYVLITTRNPLQLQFEFALWTRSMVRELIRRELGIRFSEVQVGRLLRKLGLTPQRPLRRAYQQDAEAVRHWMETEYPAIRAEAQRVGAEIYFGDEAGVRSDYHSGTTWAPRGQTPVVESTGDRFGLNLISAISPRGRLRFMTVEGKLSGDTFIEFLKRLLHGSQSPVFLIVDRHPAHRAKVVTKFVASTKGRLRLFYLPPYSPELNPDELVWKHVKHDNVGRSRIDSPASLALKVASSLRRLQKLPQLVRSFFRTPTAAYAIS